MLVTVFSDSNKKYPSTGLLKEELVKNDYYSQDMELLDYKVISSIKKNFSFAF